MPAPPEAGGGADAAALRIAIVGAESSGKSALAVALARRLGEDFGLRAVGVGEYLREWCDAHARTPRVDEQRAIALEQQRRIDAAAAEDGVDVVLCDTTPLMTDVYSELLFDDCSLEPIAHACHRGLDATLLTALDLPWVADGLQRDGPHVRGPVDALVRGRLIGWGVAWSLVGGTGDARAENAIAAILPLLRARAERDAAEEVASGGGSLFSRLIATRSGPPRAAWVCERCDLPQCEQLVLAARSERGRSA